MSHPDSPRTALATFGALLTGGALALVCGLRVPPPDTPSPSVVLAEILESTGRDYVEELSAAQLENLAYRSFDGLLKSLDRHSGYIPPSEVVEFEGDTEGFFVGIGIVLRNPANEEEYPLISGVIRGGPAEEAGVEEGDLIQEVEGEDVRGNRIAEVSQRIRGREHTRVNLSLLRGDDQRQIPVTRRRVQTSSLTSVRLYEDAGTPVAGYIRLDQFEGNSHAEIHIAGERLLEAGASSLILDLRDNGGGILEQAVDVAELFLDAGEVIASTRGRRRAAERETFVTSVRGPFCDIPLIILINGNSASASELVSGAIRHHGRALLIGTKSYGKWTVQHVISLGVRGASGRLKLTTKSFHPPDGGLGVRRDEESRLIPDLRIATDPGTRQKLRKDWLDDYHRRVSRPLDVDRVPVPRFSESETDEPHVDAPLVRAISILAQPQTYQAMQADLKSTGELSKHLPRGEDPPEDDNP